MEAIAALRSIQADSIRGADIGNHSLLCICPAASRKCLCCLCTHVVAQGAQGSQCAWPFAGYVAEAIAAGWPYAWHRLGVRPSALAFVALVVRHALTVAELWPRSGLGWGSEGAPGACPAQPLPDASALAGSDASRSCAAVSTAGEGMNPEGLGMAGGVAAPVAGQGDQPGRPCAAAVAATGAWPGCGRPDAEGLQATGLHVEEHGDAAAAEHLDRAASYAPGAAVAAACKSPRPWDPLAELAAARGEEARATLKWLMTTLPQGCDMSYGQARARQQPCVLSMCTAVSVCAEQIHASNDGRCRSCRSHHLQPLCGVCLELHMLLRLQACKRVPTAACLPRAGAARHGAPGPLPEHPRRAGLSRCCSTGCPARGSHWRMRSPRHSRASAQCTWHVGRWPGSSRGLPRLLLLRWATGPRQNRAHGEPEAWHPLPGHPRGACFSCCCCAKG